MNQEALPKILIVDDEPDLRDAIAFDFKRKGFNVFTASCGVDAISILKKESINVVLSDVRMPNGDGLTILDYVKSQNVFLPVVMFITGFADITLEEAFDRGADAVFSKPFDRKVLMETVSRAIQPMTERFQRKEVRVDVEIPVGLSFGGGVAMISTKMTNLGRGGMFVVLDKEFPKIGEPVEFRIEASIKGIFEIVGSGVVRWIREREIEGAPSGCGIEITNLDPTCLSRVVELVNYLKTRSFIPKKY